MCATRDIPLTLAETAEAQARRAAGASVEEIAEILSSSANAVRAALRGNVRHHAGDPAAVRPTPLTPAEIQQAWRLHKLGTSYREIADLLMTTVPRVDFAVTQARRAAKQANALASLAADNARSDEIARREISDAPPAEPTIGDLLRTPVPQRTDRQIVDALRPPRRGKRVH